MRVEARIERLIALIAITLLICLSCLCSCTSKSGNRDKQPLEKVVILDGLESYAAGANLVNSYKVKRINLNVVTWIKVYNTPTYDIGDTILYRFQSYENR